MKFNIFLVAFVVLGPVQGFSRKTKTKNDWQKALFDVVQSLARENWMVTTFQDKVSNETLKLSATIPHIVSKFPNIFPRYEMKSSAIVSIKSIAALIDFRSRLSLHLNFPMTNQVIFHIRNGTFDELKMIKTAETDYFVIEEEFSIRLLTFVQFTPEKCNAHQLIEVNSFDRKNRRWQHKSFKIDKFSNFYGCPLKFLKGSREIPFLADCEGILCSILKDFSVSLNYTNRMILYRRVYIETGSQDR